MSDETSIVERLLTRAASYRQGGPSSEHTALLLEISATEIERLQARVKELEEGLETYADEDNWHNDEFRPTRLEDGCRCLSCYEVYSDRGAEARALLQGEKK